MLRHSFAARSPHLRDSGTKPSSQQLPAVHFPKYLIDSIAGKKKTTLSNSLSGRSVRKHKTANPEQDAL